MAVDILDEAAITQYIETLLEDSPIVGQSGGGATVERYGDEPNDPPVNGWVGIFRVAQRFPIIIAGAGQGGRNHRIDLMLMLVQYSDAGDTCGDALSALVKNVIDEILNNASLGGQVDFIDELEVVYPDYQKAGENNSHYIQRAFIFFTGVKRI